MSTRRMHILILEDDADRREAMLDRLADRFPFYCVQVFDAVAPMVRRLESQGLDDVILMSLDHDLNLLPGADGEWIDPGTGLELADWLARQRPVCPVIVHTTNTQDGTRMQRVLEESGWRTSRVIPFDDLAWIDEDWIRVVRREIVRCADFSVRKSPEESLTPKIERVT